MCRTMNELEKVVADYRSLNTLLDEISAEVEDLKLILALQQNIRESASTEDYMLNRLGSNPLPTK